MKQRKQEIGKIYIKAQAIIVSIVFCASILTFQNAKAQTISMDQLPIEDALRRLQLMGKIESDISFMSRPLQPTKIGAWDSALKLLDYKDNTCLEAGLTDMWKWAQQQPKREQKSWET